jgi:hypothetical protein
MSLIRLNWLGESGLDTIGFWATADGDSKEALPGILITLPLGVVDETSGQKFDNLVLLWFKFSQYCNLSPCETYFFRAKVITCAGFVMAESFDSLSRSKWTR